MKKIIILLSLSFLLSNCGFQKDERCYQKVIGHGACFGMPSGIEYNNGTCIRTGASGCGVSTPFKTIEECKEVCE